MCVCALGWGAMAGAAVMAIMGACLPSSPACQSSLPASVLRTCLLLLFLFQAVALQTRLPTLVPNRCTRARSSRRAASTRQPAGRRSPRVGRRAAPPGGLSASCLLVIVAAPRPCIASYVPPELPSHTPLFSPHQPHPQTTATWSPTAATSSPTRTCPAASSWARR